MADHITEEEQIEALKNWWFRYGKRILLVFGVVFVGFLILKHTGFVDMRYIVWKETIGYIPITSYEVLFGRKVYLDLLR